MRTRLKNWWDKYEKWLVPMMVVMFFAAGVQLGIQAGRSEAQASLNIIISKLNDRIVDKDKRLRDLQDRQIDKGDDTMEALKQSVQAAKSSAESAKISAESAQRNTP